MFITAVCVIFLIKLRWPKNKSLYDKVYQVPKQPQLKYTVIYGHPFPDFHVMDGLYGKYNLTVHQMCDV